MQSTVAVKRPGPPVPPRPKTTTPTTATAATVAATTPPPIIQKKPTFVSQLSAVGRTLVYKSPSLNLNQKKQAQTQTPTTALVATATATIAPATAPKPPLKLRKAPAVPTAKPRDSVLISVNRANSLSSAPVQSPPALKDTRLSLGKVDFERAGLLPTSQPLPRPRKIVQFPVATLDMDEEEVAPVFVAPPTTPANSIFRRSKTTLDSPISSHNGHSSYLGGKTVEFKNNLKNAAERLFSEIIISQSQKQSAADTTIITKHERAIQHQALLEQELELERHKRSQLERERSRCEREQQVTIQAAGNCTRININNTTTTPKPIQMSSLSAGNTPVKKHAFHELLISELAAMRNRSCSLEQLPTTKSQTNMVTPLKTMPRPRYNSIEDADTEDVDADNVEDADGDGDEEDTLTYAINKTLKENNNNNNNNNGVNLNGSSTPRKRCPSGCSSDSSPYGTERSQRIRTSDWIEVGDNGKQVTLTSCHISLEDSGMEDEERLDDMSSSGVGDSWDSVKEAERENEKRCRNVKRSGMSISGLPPLPKSLSGFNKLLGSDSGLLSDVEAQQELENSSNNNNNNKENESGNKLASQIVSDNKSNNNNNNLNSDKQTSKDSSSSKDNANDKSAMAKAESAAAALKATSITTTILAANANETENKTTTTATATTKATTTITTLAPSSPAKINVTGSTLDAQIATLRKEMYGLRQLDLSLLSQLWALNDSIQEFRTMIEEQDDEEDDDGDVELDEQGNRRHSPTPSSYDSVSSEGCAEDADLVLQAKAKRLGTIPKVITTQPKQQQQHLKADVKPVPRMRSAPPPPPPVALMCTARKAAAPPRPT